MPTRLTESERQRMINTYEVERQRRSVEWGKCFCGCGLLTSIATRSRFRDGTAKGLPMRYVSGHNRTLSHSHYIEQDRGYSTRCWIWLRGVNELGYGLMTGPQNRRAHRYYYELEYGPIPFNLELDHLCRVPACVNPLHLEPVTHAENSRRGSRTKLTWKDVSMIRQLASTGTAQKQIAPMFGISTGYVSQIVHYRTWSNY